MLISSRKRSSLLLDARAFRVKQFPSVVLEIYRRSISCPISFGLCTDAPTDDTCRGGRVL